LPGAWCITLHFKIKKGLDIPISGSPVQEVSAGVSVSSVALLGPDTIDLKPGMLVAVGDKVKLGQPLFKDKQNPGVQFTSPGSGTVTAVNRGERRVLQSVVVTLDGDDAEQFASYSKNEWQNISEQDARQNLLASGLWTAFRTRPFSKIPQPDDKPAAIFVTAMDTNPLAADPDVVVQRESDAFVQGLDILSRLTDGTVHICTAPDSSIPCPDDDNFKASQFAGPHPAGLAGTHIHLLHPVSEDRVVWQIGYQDVIAIGKLFATGRLPVDRVVALCGPAVSRPRLVSTRLGANIAELIDREIEGSAVRVVSGSVLSGHRAAGWGAWLGRYDNQITVLPEGSPREFLSFMRPGFAKYSETRSFVGNLFGSNEYPLTTTQNGSPRAMVSTGGFERVMPLDILPTPLLKALLVRDTDSARDLGCLELAEEDLALCSFVCNGKYQYGPHLRKNLREIEVNG
jgi:Na+-transporting NADH:ubiquinone oxidoreductase subunit A